MDRSSADARDTTRRALRAEPRAPLQSTCVGAKGCPEDDDHEEHPGSDQNRVALHELGQCAEQADSLDRHFGSHRTAPCVIARSQRCSIDGFSSAYHDASHR
jgi:hypothetical protein